MLPAYVIALMVAVGLATWAYNKTMERTGQNNQAAIIIMAVTGIFSFFIFMTIVWFVDSALAV